MDINHLDLNLMAVFETVFTERNLSRAGEKLGLSQPAVSAALGRLRQVYNDTLFTRTARQMAPTAKAEELAPLIQQALDLLRESLKDKGEFIPAKCERVFRVAMSDWVQIALLPSLHEWLSREARKAELQVRQYAPQEMQKALEQGELDLVVTGLPRFGDQAFSQKLFHEEYRCIVWKKHSSIKGKLTLKQFTEFPHLLYSPEGKGTATVDAALRKKGLSRKIAMRVPHSMIMPLLVRGTDLIASIPQKLAVLFSDLMDLAVFKPPLALPGHDIVQYWHKKHHQDPEHQWFRAGIVRLSKQLDGAARK